MPEPRYHIIFSTLIDGRNPEQVYHDLADLFKIDQDLVQRIFACQGAVVKRGLDREAAEQYVQIILAAGAICVIEPMPADTGRADAAGAPAYGREDGAAENQALHEEKGPGVADEPIRQPDSVFRAEAVSGDEGAGRQSIVRAPGFGALLLLAGALSPVMSGSARLYWPWQFAFEPQPPGLLWWVLLPAVAGALIALLRGPACSLIVLCAGAVALLGGTVVLWEAALIVPLRILPADRPAALAFVLPLLGAALCSAACSAMEDLGELFMLRLLAACGSVAVIFPACAALFSGGPVWGRWPLILLLLLLLLYAVLALVCAFLPAVPEALLRQVRLLCVLLVCWAPFAVLLAHLPPAAPDSTAALIAAVLKTALLCYGALAAIACGLRNEFLYRFEK
ncbi:MAG: hypothetical protein FJ119_09915 [Deltaproteobacteria bacterium]|nr:hypothetical protein [Deltaproteobacteria bacterium]